MGPFSTSRTSFGSTRPPLNRRGQAILGSKNRASTPALREDRSQSPRMEEKKLSVRLFQGTIACTQRSSR